LWIETDFFVICGTHYSSLKLSEMFIFKEIFMKGKNFLAHIRFLSLLGLFVMVLSLHNGCSPQKDKSPNNEQVEGVPKVTLKGINDTIVVRKSDYDEIKSYSADYGYMTNGIILSDSMVEIIRDLESPILKIEFDEGYKIAKGMPRLSSSLPCECNYSYYFDDENPNRRVRLEGVKGDEIHFGLGIPFPDPMGKVK